MVILLVIFEINWLIKLGDRFNFWVGCGVVGVDLEDCVDGFCLVFLVFFFGGVVIIWVVCFFNCVDCLVGIFLKN